MHVVGLLLVALWIPQVQLLFIAVLDPVLGTATLLVAQLQPYILKPKHRV